MEPTAEVIWRFLRERDEGWSAIRCLYAYLAPRTKEILYIGKAWGVSVRERWSRSAKAEFWADLERRRGIRSHGVLLGELALPRNVRLTQHLLADIESLLIHELKPWGNIQCRDSRISRPGLMVRCRGSWPVGQTMYRDVGWLFRYNIPTVEVAR